MHAHLWSAVRAFLLVLVAIPSAYAANVDWSQDLHQQEMLALTGMKPVVVFFIGNGQWNPAVFTSEPVDSLGALANYAWVGSNLENQVTPDQIALEKQFNVTQFPTIVLMRPVKTGSDGKGGDNYTFRESTRCVVSKPGVCAAAIIAAVKSGK